MIDDLTIIYLTANEMPEHWCRYQIAHLVNAADGCPIISISREPIDLGTNLIDKEPKSYWNIYMQLLRGCHAAKTPFVAVAEDDVLYTRAHFGEFRPPMTAVAYDRSRWSLFVWDKKPMYCLRQRLSNCSLIAPRELLLNALETRKRTWPNGAPQHLVGEVGRAKVHQRMNEPVVQCVEWYSYGPIVQLNHSNGTEDAQRRNFKRHGQLRAYDIPNWGKARDLVAIYAGH